MPRTASGVLMCSTAGGASGTGSASVSVPSERTNEIFGATDSDAAAAPTAIKKPTPKMSTLLRQLIFIMTRCAFGELRRCVRLFFRAPQTPAHNDTKRYREHTCTDEEKTVPAIGEPQKREHGDKSAGEHYECVDGHDDSIPHLVQGIWRDTTMSQLQSLLRLLL